MKRLMAGMMSLVLAASLLTGCEKEPEGLFYQLTGIDPDDAMLTVDGREVPAELYLYWVLGAADYLCASRPDLCGEDGAPDWDAELESGMTVRESVLAEALDNAKMHAVIECWAEEYDVTLGADTEEAIDREIASVTEQLGGEEAMEQYLASRGLTAETNRRLSRLFYLYANMLALTKEEGSPLYITDEVLYQYEGITPETVLADHILARYPEDEADRPAARANMEQVLETILSDEDPVAAFQFVADNYSEDAGRTYYPNGYLVTADAPYVQVFKDTALSLAEYEISGVVESEFGYHIIMRKPLRDYVADTYLTEKVVAAMEEAEVVWSDAADGFDPEVFYAGYLAAEGS